MQRWASISDGRKSRAQMPIVIWIVNVCIPIGWKNHTPAIAQIQIQNVRILDYNFVGHSLWVLLSAGNKLEQVATILYKKIMCIPRAREKPNHCQDVTPNKSWKIFLTSIFPAILTSSFLRINILTGDLQKIWIIWICSILPPYVL